MSDKSKNTPETLEKSGLSRRGFLGASALTGAAVAATAFGGAVMSRETWAAAVKDAQQKIHVAPGELESRGVGEAQAICVALVEKIRSEPADNWETSHDVDEIFERLAKT